MQFLKEASNIVLFFDSFSVSTTLYAFLLVSRMFMIQRYTLTHLSLVHNSFTMCLQKLACTYELVLTHSTKTPGGKITYLHVKKLGTVPKCGDCGSDIQGIPAVRPKKVCFCLD